MRKLNPIIKWTGSKRHLAHEILNYFPNEISVYYEPFCGGCSVLYALLYSHKRVEKYVCSDVNADLIAFYSALKMIPDEIITEYSYRHGILSAMRNEKDKQAFYNDIRANYNKNRSVHDFYFLSRTSINGLIRYNSRGEFNAPFHLNRNGIKPETLKGIILEWSGILNRRNVEFRCSDYSDIQIGGNDFCFFDPPYFNTKGIYHGVIDFDIFWKFLGQLKCGYVLTFDGKRTDKDMTHDVPESCYDQHILLQGLNSSFGRICVQKNNVVQESLYIRNAK